MVNRKEILSLGKFYHVYNRAVGDDLLFREPRNYTFFMGLIRRYLNPVSQLYAYCLMPNHFHFLIYVKDGDAIALRSEGCNDVNFEKFVHQSFSNFFNSYSKAYNRIYKRKGKLFLQSYSRILLTNELHIRTIIKYIHRNPIHHKFVTEYSNWTYSSYKEYLRKKGRWVEVSEGLKLFGSFLNFIRDHEEFVDLTGLKDLSGLMT